MSIINNGLLLASQAAAAGGYTIERSLRFNSSDSAYLSKQWATAATDGRKYTISMWYKSAHKGVNQRLFGARLDSNNYMECYHLANGTLNWYNAWPLKYERTTTQVLRDCGAWYHLLFVFDSTASGDNMVRIYINGSEVTQFSSKINPSSNLVDYWHYNGVTNRIGVSVDTSSAFLDGYLADIYSIDGQALDPTSFGEFDTNGVWQPIEYTGSYGTNGFHLPFSDNSSAVALGTDTSGNGNTWTVNNIAVSSAIYGRLATSGSDAPSSPIGSPTYGNGSTNILNPSSTNGEGDFQNTRVIGFQNITGVTSLRVLRVSGPNAYLGFNGSLSSVGSFGSLSYPATINQAAWYTVSNPPSTITSMAFSGGSSGPSNQHQIYRIEVNGVVLYDAAPSGIDSLVDTPTSYGTDTGAGGEVRGNYCTLNPLKNAGTLSNGNLDADFAAGAEKLCVGTFGMQTGKWYFEVTKTSGLYGTIGIANNLTTTASYVGQTANTWGYATDGNKYTNGSSSAYGSTWTSGDVIGVAFDADAGSLFFYKNGVVQNSGTAAFTSLTSGPYFPAVGNQNFACVCNFGARPFAYTAPSGFKALCTTNLPTPTIADGSTAMDVVLYTGDGGTQTISGLGFSPDFVWTKVRNIGYGHRVWDTVRGATKRLETHDTTAEVTESTALTAFNSDGFTVGSEANVNQSGRPYVAWTWDAGSSTVTNTSGSISSQVRANASAGFSIVTYTGNGTSPSTIGHGLGVAPKLIITKNRDAAYNWITYSSEIGSSQVLALDTTLAAFTPSGGNYGSVTSSTYQVVQGSNFTNLNRSGDNYVAYCFAPVAGYSAFGSYTANGVNDGPFQWCGFRPRWIMIKAATDTTYASYNGWIMIDTARYSYNGLAGANLFANASYQEGTGGTGAVNPLVWLDILSNGFKIRRGETEVNFNGTYIYAAFAEHPFQTARAR